MDQFRPTHPALDVYKSRSIILMRHLEDQDTLLSEGRDNSLKPNQETKALEIATEINNEAIKKKCPKVKFYVSDKNRAKQSFGLISEALGKSKYVTEISNVYESRINELDNGIMNFLASYNDGDWFEPLPKAWDAFFSEISQTNLLYRFGDPSTQQNGKSLYPEIGSHFSKFGENYAEFCSRIFEFFANLNITKPQYRNSNIVT